MTTPQRKTWFFVADGSKARVMESYGAEEGWRQIEFWEDESARAPARELEASPPARGQKIAAGQRHAFDRASEHDKAEEAFIKERASFLNQAANTGSFDQLVFSAPPRALAVFRRNFSTAVTDKCVSMLDKDLTNMPDAELLQYFRENSPKW